MTHSSHGLRLIFAGTPEFAATHLQGVLDRGHHQVIAVYTQPDRPAGRGNRLTASAVKKLAEQYHLTVFQPESLKDQAAQTELRELQADLMVVVAYGLILPPEVLAAPRLGCINVHASLLPRWRGAAPIQRAIAAGDQQTGITIMQMDAGLDTGPILLQAACDIAALDTAASLQNKLANMGVPALSTALSRIESGSLVAKQQNEKQSCYAAKIAKEEARIDWQQTATVIERKIRAFNPFPIAFTELNGARIKIHKASVGSAASGRPGTVLSADKKGLIVACGRGSLVLEQIQLPGSKVLPVSDILNARSSLFHTGITFLQQTENQGGS